MLFPSFPTDVFCHVHHFCLGRRPLFSANESPIHRSYFWMRSIFNWTDNPPLGKESQQVFFIRCQDSSRPKSNGLPGWALSIHQASGISRRAYIHGGNTFVARLILGSHPGGSHYGTPVRPNIFGG